MLAAITLVLAMLICLVILIATSYKDQRPPGGV